MAKAVLADAEFCSHTCRNFAAFTLLRDPLWVDERINHRDTESTEGNGGHRINDSLRSPRCPLCLRGEVSGLPGLR